MGPGKKGPKGPGMKDSHEDSVDYVDPEAEPEPEPEPEPGMDGMMGGMMKHMMKDMMENMKSGMMMGPDMYPVLSNISCIMEEMQWTDKHGMPNAKAIKYMIKDLNL